MQLKTSSNLKQINFLLGVNLNKLLTALKIYLYEDETRYVGCCGIHGGDNITAFNINITGDYKWKWKCWTNGGVCNNTFHNSLIGLVRGRLSSAQGWRQAGDDIVSFPDTLAWIDNFLAGKNITLNINDKSNKVIKNKFNPLLGYPRNKVKQSLKIPCPYFSARINPEILTRYDIGLCDNPLQKFYHRTICPCYNKELNSLEGISARSIFKICTSCKLYHDAKIKCPSKPELFGVYAKWRHSPGLKTSDYLFNLYENFDLIKSCGSVILVESIGNALKLVQNNINNVVCTFGCKLSENQAGLLHTANVRKIIIAFDNDNSGRNGAKSILNKYDKKFNMKAIFPTPEGKDYADCTDDFIKSILRKEINNVFKY